MNVVYTYEEAVEAIKTALGISNMAAEDMLCRGVFARPDGRFWKTAVDEMVARVLSTRKVAK